MNYDYLIVGAGLFGSVLAERIANDQKAGVLIIDKRSHIGGNCYSETDEDTYIETHRYGTHVFHTSSKKVWEYITQFTEFNAYHHQVLSTYKNIVYQMPINLETINSFYNANFSPLEAREFIKKEVEKEKFTDPANLEEKAVSLIGRPLYDAFIKGYTIKQWNNDPKELPPDIITRLPVRYNYQEDYFVDARWQGIPMNGYTEVFRRLLQSPNIHVELNCDYFDNVNKYDAVRKIIYTGPIDAFFNYTHGKLEWRSIQLEKEVIETEDFQGTSVMNFSDIEIPYTRIHEPRHLHPERNYTKKKTVVFYETSVTDNDNPFYPINSNKNKEIFLKYKQMAENNGNAIIGGRLGDYAYYDMDKAVLAALNCYEDKILSDI